MLLNYYFTTLLSFILLLKADTHLMADGDGRNFHLGRGYSPGGLWDGSPQVGSRVKSQYWVWATSFLWSWHSLQTLFTDFDCRIDQNLKILHNSPDSW